MMTKQELIAFSDSLPLSTHDCPFEEDFETTVLRHSDTGKWFGIILDAPPSAVGREGDSPVLCVNLKSKPEDTFVLREIFPDIYPAYHMNHYHWITVPLDGNLPKEVLFSLVEKSHSLTKKKTKAK